MEKWQCGRFELDFKTPKIMGIVNLTPDSFSGENIFHNPTNALQYAEQQVRDGADLLDIGAESSRPYSEPVLPDEEWQRLYPVLKEVIHWNVPISVDTYHFETMQKVLDLGVDFINDITGLQNQSVRKVLAQSTCAICLMHMQNNPKTMQNAPTYTNVVQNIFDFFKQQAALCQQDGIDLKRIIFDPGFGFGKNLEQNLALVHAIPQFKKEFLLLVGFSRKSMLGQITGNDVHNRVIESVTAALKSVELGANIVRVHDVKATKDAFLIHQAFSI